MECVKNSIFALEKMKHGHVICILNNIKFKQINNNEMKQEAIDHIVLTIKESLEISKKYNNFVNYAHIYLYDVSMKNFNLTFFKKLNKRLDSEFQDTLGRCYLYSTSKNFEKLWNFIKNFIDKDTKTKFKLVKSYQNG